jgi:hypothetical protein
MNLVLIDTPSTNDVLCGKDKTYQLHPGNRLYRRLIEEVAALYSTIATKQDKMSMTQNIVHTMMHAHGARFLRPFSDDQWVEITHQMARDKTSHALRFCAASLGRKQPPPATPTSKRGHRRTVSRDSNVLSTISSNSKSNKRRRRSGRTSAIVASKRVYNDCNDLFARQQAILHQTLRVSNYSMEDDLDEEPIPVVATSSEDLDIILSQPLSVHDWDGLFQDL